MSDDIVKAKTPFDDGQWRLNLDRSNNFKIRITRAVLLGSIVATIALAQWLKYYSLPPFSVISGLTNRQPNISEEFNQRINRYFDLPLSEEELLQKLETQGFDGGADENYAEHWYKGSPESDLFVYRIAWNEEGGKVTEITGRVSSYP